MDKKNQNMTNFKNLHLNEKILNALEKKGYNTPTAIQLQAIPHIMEGRDLLGIAQTGTGKTAAFSLPILHNLVKSNNVVKSGGVRVLILTPTRELASQIADNIELYGKELGLRYTVMFGGVNEKPQIAAIQRGVDILIATPGRLLDLTSQGYIRYMQLEVLVLDEADRMLDMGFINDIKKIIQRIPEKRQTLFFSATMPSTIIGLANSILKNPVKVEVTPASTTVERIDQKVLFVEKSHKLSLLKKLLKDETATSTLVFCKTKHGSNKVVEFLEKNAVSVAAIHGNKSQAAREKALAAFRSGQIKVLVATDIAARGIDIPAISHIINYDIPLDPESYVHRIGRTARAGLNGIAISFCDSSEMKYLREVEKTIKLKIPVDESHPYHGVEAAPSSSSDRDSFEPRGRRENSNQARPRARTSENRFRSDGDDRRAPRPRSDARSDYRRDDSRRDDNRRTERPDSRNANNRKDFRATDNKIDGRKIKTEGEKKIFGLFSFNKKESDAGPSSSRGQDNRGARSSSNPRFNSDRVESKKEPFGFGWFGKKKTSTRDRESPSGESFGFADRKKPSHSNGRKPYAGGSSSSRARSGGGNFGNRNGNK